MKYKLIRKLRKCPLPVGSVGEEDCVMGEMLCRFRWTGPARSCIPDERAWEIPLWLCQSIPHHFKKVRSNARSHFPSDSEVK